MYKSGDVLLYESTGLTFKNLIAESIRLITGNRVIHVAFYWGTRGERHTIVESLGSVGVDVKELTDEELVNHPDGFRLFGISRLEGAPMVVYKTYDYIGSHYGYLTIINLMFQHGKTRLFPKRPWTTWFKSRDGYICSELCQLIVEQAIPDYKFPKLAHLVEPDDYLTAPWKTYDIKNNRETA